MSDGFLIKYSDIFKLEQSYKTNLERLMENIDECSTAIATFIGDDTYTGATATAVKNYLLDVHITLLASIKTIAQNMLDNMALYKAGYYSVDESTNFLLNEYMINQYKLGLSSKLETVLGCETNILTTLDSISGIFSYGGVPSTMTIQGSHESMNTELDTLVENVSELERQTVSAIQGSAGLLLEYLSKCISDAGTSYTGITNYEAGDFYTKSNVYALANLSEVFYQQHESNKDVYDEIWETEQQLADAADERETEGVWKTIGGGVLIVGGAACIFFTAGAATPIVVAGAVAGGGTVAFGVADSYEGAQEIYYGKNGDTSSVAVNGIRDELFKGNEQAYQITESIFAFSASAMVPIGAAANAGTLTFRSGSVAVGKLAVSSLAGTGASQITMDATGNRALSMIAGMGASTVTGIGLNALDIKNGWSYNPSETARGWQGSGLYPGVDEYENIYLKKGEDIYILESDYEVLNNKHSGYATTKSAVVDSSYNSTTLSEGLQIKPYYDESAAIPPTYAEYRSQVTRYTVNKQLLATGYSEQTLANPQFGAGGLPQYFIENIEKEIASGGLIRGESIPLTNYQIKPEQYYSMIYNTPN